MNGKEKKYICIISRDLNAAQKKEWQELWSASESRHIFNSLIFFEAYCEAFCREKYAVIFCYKKGKLRGLLPLIEDRVFGVKTFLCPGTKGNYADKNATLVIARDAEIYSILLNKASALGNLYLAELDGREKNSFDFKKSNFMVEWASMTSWLALLERKSLYDFMSKWQKRSMLKHIQQREKDLELRFFSRDLKTVFEKVIEVEKGSYKFHRRTALFKNKMSKILLISLIKRNCQNIRIGILYLKKQPVATILGFVYGKTFAAYHMAFLKEHRNWGAGKAAIYMAMERLKNEGFSKVDLLRGGLEFKRQFTDNTDDQYNVYLAKNSFIFLWWKICIPARNSLKRIKVLLDAVLSAFEPPRAPIFFNIAEYMKKNYFSELDFWVRIKNIIAINFWDRAERDNKSFNKNKKPVIFFSSYDDRNNPYYAGGGSFAVHEVAKRLTIQFEVHVLAGKYPHSPERKIFDGVHYEYIGSSLFGPRLGHLVFHFMLPFYAAMKEFDIWIESFTPPFSTSFLPIFTKKPVIGLAHMLAAEDMLRKYRIPFGFIENYGIKMYDNFIVLTEQSGRKIRKFNPCAHIEVIPNGVDSASFSGRFLKKHLLYIGRIEMNQKGLDMLLESYRLIADKIGHPLIIAGQGTLQEEQKLKKMINDLGISNNVNFLGRVEGRKKSQILEEAIAVIIPSRLETFSLVALEALAYGRPIISFDIEGLKWLPEKFSYKIKPFDVSAMAMMAKKISGNDSRIIQIDQEEVKKFLKLHSWEIIAEKFTKRIESIIKLNI